MRSGVAEDWFGSATSCGAANQAEQFHGVGGISRNGWNPNSCAKTGQVARKTGGYTVLVAVVEGVDHVTLCFERRSLLSQPEPNTMMCESYLVQSWEP